MRNINKNFALREKDNKKLESSSSQTVFKPNCIKPTVDFISKPNIWFERWPNVSCYYVQSVLAISSVLSDSILWLTTRNVTSSCPVSVSVDRCRARGARASHECGGMDVRRTSRSNGPQGHITASAHSSSLTLSAEAERLSRPSFTIQDNKLCCVLIWCRSPGQVWTGEQSFVQPAEWHVNQLTWCLKQLIL